MNSNRYNQTDQQLHVLCQLIAKANRTFVPEKDDDSHTNLHFDSVGQRILGRWILHNGGRYLLSLNLKDQHFELIDDDQKALASIKTESKTLVLVESEIQAAFSNLGMDASSYRSPMHYEIPNYELFDGTISKIADAALKEWCHIRELANSACERLLGHAQSKAEIRIWPHHFDTGIYTKVKEGLGIGFGLAMKDELVGLPYLYMSAYPDHGEIEFSDMPNISAAKWIDKEGLKGAVLAVDQFMNFSQDEQHQVIDGYMLASYDWFVRESA